MSERTGGTFVDVQEDVTDESRTDSSGVVVLKGTFDFGNGSVEVKAQRSIIIRGDRTTIIKGGGGKRTAPDNTLYGAFVVNSPGYMVTFQDLHFENSQAFAIQVKAVRHLLIERCAIKHVTPLLAISPPVPTAGGITVDVGASGDLIIRDNTFDVGGSSTDRTFAIQIRQNSQSGEASVLISGNTVNNVTAHGIALRDIKGQAIVQGNPLIKTGRVGGKPDNVPDTFVDGIMCQGLGTYLVGVNCIVCEYENSAGIRLDSTSKAEVSGNDITMSKPSGAVAGIESAGIELMRKCVSNSVSNNKISGSARAALSLVAELSKNLIPSNNQLVENSHSGFTASLADILVGEGVISSHIIPPIIMGDAPDVIAPAGTLMDLGTGTVVGGFYEMTG